MNSSTVGEIDFNQLKEMGFSNEMIQKAQEKSVKDKKSILNILLESQQTVSPLDTKQTFEPLNPEQRKRLNGFPVGLKNVGNTCYFNSLIQSYYFNPKFVKEVLSFDSEKECFKELEKTPKQNNQRLKLSIIFVKQLQKLFALMTLSEKKYIDPTDVLNSLVDDYGNQILIGDQKDVTELNFQILALVDEALSYEFKRNKKAQSLISLNGRDNQSQIIEIEEEDFNIMSSIKLLKKYTKYFDETEFAKLFFGKLQESITYIENNKEITNTDDIVMGPIILDVSHKDLYSSWENFSHASIDEFKISNGTIAKAVKTYWIVRSPETLCFQLQRVGFNKEKGLEKINNVFRFEKEIYIDRFLIENNKTYYQNQDKIKNLQSKIGKTQEIIEKMNNYAKCNLSIFELIDHTVNMMKTKMDLEFEKNGESMDLLEDFTFITEKNEDSITEKDKSTVTNILNQFKNENKRKIEKLNKDLMNYKREYENIYSNMKSKKYILTAILMHEGKAESGHYYSYILDYGRQIWRRFSDIQVIDELNEEQILKEAYGMDNKSAYFLVYCSEKIFSSNSVPMFTDILGLESPHSDLTNHLTIKENHNIYDYNSFISRSLKTEVMRDNMAFEKELVEFQSSSNASQIIENYNDRFVFANEYVRKHKEKLKTNPNYCSPLLNFGVYLRDDLEIQDNIFKWHLLDCALREMTNNKITIHDMKSQIALESKLNELFSYMTSFKRPLKIIMNQQEISKLEMKFSEYISKLQMRESIIYIMNLICENKINESYHLTYELITTLSPSTYFYKIVHHLSKMINLKQAIQLIPLFDHANNSNQIFETVKNIVVFIKTLQPTDNVTLQIINIIIELMQKDKNQNISEFLAKHLSMIRTKQCPKEYEKKFIEVEKFNENLPSYVVEIYPYLWKITDKEDEQEKKLNSLIGDIFAKNKKYFELIEFIEIKKTISIADIKSKVGII